MVCSVVLINTNDGSFGVNHQEVAPLLWPDPGCPQTRSSTLRIHQDLSLLPPLNPLNIRGSSSSHCWSINAGPTELFANLTYQEYLQ